MYDFRLVPSWCMIGVPGVLEERALEVSVPELCFVFAQTFFESSARLTDVCSVACDVTAWDFVDDAELRGVVGAGGRKHFP